MRTMPILILSIIFLSTNFNCTKAQIQDKAIEKKEAVQKIQVLNFGTFHMGFTNDGSKTEFDQHDLDNQKKVHEIAKKIAAFKPTVILVETPPSYNEKLQAEYRQYLEKPDMYFKSPSEIELLAYELGRLSNTKRIYGIDHKMGYNYRIAGQIENTIDSTLCKQYFSNPFQFYPTIEPDEKNMSLLENLIQTNQNTYLDFLIAVNADMLTHAGTEQNFEGADEAAKYYQRNLRMYSNMNRILLDKEDRVFILMGASHTAFFRDFISRSPKYKMVNTFDYLK